MSWRKPKRTKLKNMIKEPDEIWYASVYCGGIHVEDCYRLLERYSRKETFSNQRGTYEDVVTHYLDLQNIVTGEITKKNRMRLFKAVNFDQRLLREWKNLRGEILINDVGL